MKKFIIKNSKNRDKLSLKIIQHNRVSDTKIYNKYLKKIL
jgi:hypothetical protein